MLQNATESPLKKAAPKAWAKQNKKKKGKNKKGGKKTTKPQVVVQKAAVPAKEEPEKGAGGDQDQTPNKVMRKVRIHAVNNLRHLTSRYILCCININCRMLAL